jgi:urea transport system permease protein
MGAFPLTRLLDRSSAVFLILLAAFSLGIANKFLEPFAGAVLGKIAILVFIIIFIQRRPQGMFALKGRSVE